MNPESKEMGGKNWQRLGWMWYKKVNTMAYRVAGDSRYHLHQFAALGVADTFNPPFSRGN